MSSNPLPQDPDALLVSRNQLPTLFEILSWRTLPPIDIISFYMHMLGQEQSVDYLDFLVGSNISTVPTYEEYMPTTCSRLNVSQHLSLCRQYVRSTHSSVLSEESNSSPGPVTPLAAIPAKYTSAARNITRTDLRASATKILYTYLILDSERRIVVPESIVKEVIAGVEEQGLYDPEIFNEAKNYVFQVMERDAFPGFLRAKGLGNLTRMSQYPRVR